jgi:hypothetical protein
MTPERPTIADGLDLNETDDGLIIYVPATDRVHYLNSTASVVLQLCDGSRSSAEIAAEVGELFQLAVAPVAETEDCLQRLGHEGLVS